MDFVTPWLAIGAQSEAADAALRRRHGIGSVLSLLPVDFDAGEAHLTLPIDDRVALPAAAIRQATAFIEHQRHAGRKTLLHCRMGISRSPAVAACYLHEYAERPLADALAEVRRARPQADPHAALLASMAAHYGSGVELANASVNDSANDSVDATDAGADDLSNDPASHSAVASNLRTATPPAIDLSANENALGASPRALAALQSALSGVHRYPDRRADALRRDLARRLGGAPEQVVLGNGSCELLDLAARAFLAPGDAAIIAPPCFPAYRSAVRRAHGELIEVPLSARDDFAYRLDAIRAAIDARTRLIFLGNPNNPTGTGVAAGAFAAWLTTLPPHVVVVLDEAYRDYVEDAAPAPLADGPALVRAGQRLLVLRSFSKLHGLAGLRLGYAFGPAVLIAALEALRPTYNTNAPAQAAALAALGDHEHQVASRRRVAAGRNELARGLAALGLPCLPSHGNFVLTRCDHRGHDANVIAAGLAAACIQVKPGAAFGLPGYLRISVGLPEEHDRLFDELARLLAAAPELKTQPEHNATQGS